MESHAEPCPACNPTPVAWGIPDHLEGEDFSTFRQQLNPEMAPAYERCRQVALGNEWCAFLVSKPGRGKTHLAVGALKASAYPKPGLFWNWANLLRQIRAWCFDENGPHLNEDDVLGRYQSSRSLLVLDDVGAEKQTEWAVQTLYAILNARYEKSLPTIVTTNNADAIDDRVLSRYARGTVVVGGGTDIRRV